MAHRFRTRVICLVAAVAAGIAYPSGACRAQGEDGQKIYERTLRGTVWVLARQSGDRLSSGTGSLIDLTRRLVITNFHVVRDSDNVTVFFPHFANGKLIAERTHYFQLFGKDAGIRGRVLARDSRRDLALIELDTVPRGVQVVRLSRTGVQPGQVVHSIGNPGQSGALWVYTQGSVRAVYHKKWSVKAGASIHEFDTEVVETQSPTNPGDSGGPLVNKDGDLVGVTQGYVADAHQLSLFIDVSEVKEFLKSKKLLGHLPPPVASNSTTEKPKLTTESPAESVTADDKIEQAAATKLKFAKTLADDGKLERAKDRCEKIIADYPKTKAAAEAKVLLEKLNK